MYKGVYREVQLPKSRHEMFKNMPQCNGQSCSNSVSFEDEDVTHIIVEAELVRIVPLKIIPMKRTLIYNQAYQMKDHQHLRKCKH